MISSKELFQRLFSFLTEKEIYFQDLSENSYPAIQISKFASQNLLIELFQYLKEQLGFLYILSEEKTKTTNHSLILLNPQNGFLLKLILEDVENILFVDKVYENFQEIFLSSSKLIGTASQKTPKSILHREQVTLRTKIPFPEDFGNGEFLFSLDGEFIKGLNFDFRSEKKEIKNHLLGKHYSEIDYFLYRINPKNFIPFNNLYYRLLERIFQISPSSRGVSIRMVSEELNRVISHLKSMISTLDELGATGVSSKFSSLKFEGTSLLSDLYDPIEKFRFSCVGGVRNDVNLEWRERISIWSLKIVKELSLLEESYFTNKHFQDILGRNSLREVSILEYFASGPLLRSFGFKLDIRKAIPYDLYHKISFEIPLGHGGKSIDKFLVRFYEIKESLRMITLLLDNLPIGKPISLDLENLELLDRERSAFQIVEGPEGIVFMEIELDTMGRIVNFSYRNSQYGSLLQLKDSMQGIPVSESLSHFFCSNINFTELGQ